MQRTSRNTVFYLGSHVDSPQSHLGGASVREASDTLPERGKLLNHMLAGKPTGCVAGATVFVNLGSNLCEDRVHLRHTSGDATGAASTKPMSAPSTARALTR